MRFMGPVLSGGAVLAPVGTGNRGRERHATRGAAVRSGAGSVRVLSCGGGARTVHLVRGEGALPPLRLRRIHPRGYLEREEGRSGATRGYWLAQSAMRVARSSTSDG
ncbi:hypothetical protein GCM10011326_10350 [Salipiger profundus]|nr:hypothetical protein GCM10011326_10350 [Salipiger profundus]